MFLVLCLDKADLSMNLLLRLSKANTVVDHSLYHCTEP